MNGYAPAVTVAFSGGKPKISFINQDKKEKILIMGGGIAGLSVAIAFKNVGVQYIIFESR